MKEEREREDKREERRERREKVDLICHVDISSTLNIHFNIVLSF